MPETLVVNHLQCTTYSLELNNDIFDQRLREIWPLVLGPEVAHCHTVSQLFPNQVHLLVAWFIYGLDHKGMWLRE